MILLVEVVKRVALKEAGVLPRRIHSVGGRTRNIAGYAVLASRFPRFASPLFETGQRGIIKDLFVDQSYQIRFSTCAIRFSVCCCLGSYTGRQKHNKCKRSQF